MALDNTLQAKYFQRPVVKQRNQVTLITWADYVATQDIPPSPDDTWVRLRIVAENVPLQLDFITGQTLGYFLQDSGTQDNIQQFLSEDNDAATEQTLSDSNQTICGTFMPRYALSTVSAQQIADWKARNGLPAR